MEECTAGEYDIFEQLPDCEKSVAPQHLQLWETATAIHSTIKSESLPLTPLSYFTTIMKTTQTYDADAVCGLLALVLPLVPSIDKSKASNTVKVLNELVCNQFEGLLALVDCLGKLLQYCDLEDWESVKLGFKTLLKHSVHRSPEVRKCAQDCAVRVFKSLQSSIVKKNASKSVLKSFKTYILLALEIIGPRSVDGSKDDGVSKREYLEVLHMFDLMKLLIHCLPKNSISKVIEVLRISVSAKFSPLMRHVLDLVKEILRFFESKSKLTPEDTLKIPKKWIDCYSSVIKCIADLLTHEEATATRASNMMIEMIERVSIYVEEEEDDDDDDGSKDSRIVVSLCDSLLDVLRAHQKGIPNAHSLGVISALFLHLGTYSQMFMRDILLKLSSFMKVESGDVKHLHECIGCGVRAMRPEKVLSLIPIAFNDKDFTCSNTWLIPIVKEYTVASSLGFFVDNIVPLAESLEEACKKVEKESVIREKLHYYARDCWGLLYAFCRHPDDMDVTFDNLAKHLISNIKKDAFMLEDIAITLQHLVKRNTNKSFRDNDKAFESYKRWYREEFGTRNIMALSSWSERLLKAFTKVLFKVSPEKRDLVKDTIACLTLITEPSAVVEAIFISSVERTKPDVSVDQVASAFTAETSTDPTDFMFNSIKNCLQEEDGNIQGGTYATIYKVLEESSKFRSLKFKQLMDLLLNLKSPDDVTSLKQRFLCFKLLLVHLIEITCDGANTYGFRMLNEIIVTLKDSKGGSRQVANDTLRDTSSILKNTSSSYKTGPYHEFITMIMGHLSGPSSDTKSGAVSALSLLIYNVSKICYLMPDLVPTILILLNSEDMDVIKAVLEFIKVLVMSLQVTDLKYFLSDILGRILPWSSVSEHRFKSKVKAILEILMWKCGSASVKSLVPERYRDFVQNVLEKCQGKASSAEDVKASGPKSGPKRSPNEEYSRQIGKWNKFDEHPGGGSKRKNTSFTKNDGPGGKKQRQW